MIDLALPREHAALLAAGMERHCPAGELEEGYALFRAGRVTHVWKDQFNIVHAIVRAEDGDRKLQLDLDFFLASECGCGRESKICAHMAAAFFLLYADHDDPAGWLGEVTRARRRVPLAGGAGTSGGESEAAADAAPAAAAGQPADRAAPDAGDGSAAPGARLAPDVSVPAGGPVARPERWGFLVDREMDRLVGLLGDRRRVDIFYLNACRRLHAFADGLPAAQRAAFRLFASLRLLLHAERRLAELPDRREAPGTMKMIQDLGRLFEQQIAHAAEMLAAAGSPGPADRSGALGLVLGQARVSLPPPGRPALDWERVHRLLWTRLFTDAALRRDEIRRLRDLAGRAQGGEQAVRIRHCLAHLHWLEGDDEAAMAEWAASGRPAPDRLVACLETLRNAGSWRRFKAWLAFAVPHLQRADGDSFRRALDAARACRDATGDEEFLRRTLADLLPRSAHAYAAFLIETKRLEEWAAFHLLNGTPIDRIDRDQRLAVERLAPRLMLPLYHQAIERLLAGKSRAAYRETARLARRLQALYRALGEEGTFRAFLARIGERHGRQRALMEEWRKGNLFA